MGTISLRMDEEDEKLIKEYAKTKNFKILKLFMKILLTRILNL